MTSPADRILALAEKATFSPWCVAELHDCVNEGYYVVRDGCEFGRAFIACLGKDNEDARNADYIAYLHPERVKAVARVIEAVASRPWITRHSGDKEDDPDMMFCEICGCDWPDPEQITNADEYPERHADSCETMEINAALSALKAMEE